MPRNGMLFLLFFNALVAFFGFYSLSSSAEENPNTLVPKVVFVLDNQAGNYLPILKGFREYSRKQVGRLIRIDLVNTENLTSAELRTQLNQGYQLAIAIGSDATSVVRDVKPELPLFTLKVNQAELLALHKASLKQKSPVTGIFLDQPFERYAKLVQLLLPNYRRVGTLLSQQTKTLKPGFDKTMRSFQFDPIVTIVRPNDLPQRILERLAKNTDVIIAVHDENIYTPANLKSHLLTAFRHQIPVVGVSRSYTDIGALAALYTDEYDLGAQTARQVIKVLDLSDFTLEPVYPEGFKVRINYNVLRSFGIESVDEATVAEQIAKTTITNGL
ncbi:MAG: hypothetical protein HWE27_04670 [Gammaproteobacteria bacterium]|nr:hypothetical protein [Gammaproteobacteria bacterium]